jgi:hypothetical protein
MTHRLLNLNTDYPILQKWWKDRNMYVIPKEYLTPFGIMSFENETPVAAAFLFPVLGCRQAMIRYPISDKNLSNEIRDKGIELVLAALHDLARSMSYKYILITTNHPNFIKRLEKMNYQRDAENCVHYLGVL